MTTSTEQISPESLYDLGFILYYRKDSEDREFNVKTVVKYIHANFPSSRIVVVSDGVSPDMEFVEFIRSFGFNSNVHGRFFENSDEFKKSTAYNIGSEFMQTEKVLCFWDVDVLIDVKYILSAYKKIKDYEYDHVYPFNGTFVDVQHDLFSDFLTRYNFSYIEKLWEMKHPSLHFASGESPGGCNLISSIAFDRMKGYDDRFIGWGFEDTDFLYRSRKVNRVKYLEEENAICWHLHHENAKRLENPHYRNNLLIFNQNAYS